MAWNTTKPFSGFSAPKDMDVDMESSPATPVENTSISKEDASDNIPKGFQESFETGIEYQKFARPLEKLQRLRRGSGNDFDMVSILPEFEALCSTRAQQFEYRKDSDAGYLAFGAMDEYKLWQSESHTWVLLTTLFGAFENQRPFVDKGPESLEWSDLDLIEHLASNDNNFKHHAAVKVWLETIAPRFTPLVTTKTYTPQSSIKPTFSFAPLTSSKKTEYLDPDATTRDGTKPSERNQEIEQDLLKTVWGYIRRGKIESAKEACIKAGEHWRAESIGGGDFYSIPIAYTDPIYDREDDRHGNKTRSLWKGTCYALANESSADQYERAIYGALCGDIPSVLPVCSSWEDHAWVQYNALVEGMIEARLSQFNRGGPCKVLPLPAAKIIYAKDIFNSLTNSENLELRTIQTSIILGQTDQLLAKMATEAKASGKSGAPLKPHLMRFLAHFVLLLRSKQSNVPKDSGDYFIKIYVDYLISRKLYGLAPLYASFLPVNLQVETCSSYLKTIDGSKKDRHEHLITIRQNGLDLHKVLTATVDDLLNNTRADFEQITDYRANLEKSIMASISGHEKANIRALEWLSFDLPQYEECLKRSNYLARKYLVQGRLNSAFALFNALPQDINQRDVNEASPASLSISHEHLYYRDLFHVRLLFEEWRDFIGSKHAENVPQSKVLAWEMGVKDKAQKAIVEIETLLTSRWIFDCILPGDEERNQELRRLRQIYISELVMNLHEVYFESRVVVPEYLGKSVEMSNLVASESGVPLYKELQESERLNEFLDRIRLSSIELIKAGQSPFGC
ncbi:Nucleoporin nup84 [Entomortierella chlamydospora]|uniref:Nuclear pore complex protein n=1 Tax=Entomortierella chlamydospora TaxID=101097 RepID=A0A9P6N210_9FUNG|nr:Nucleoporin nup84 [Entomortierella chlamydospora]